MSLVFNILVIFCELSTNWCPNVAFRFNLIIKHQKKTLNNIMLWFYFKKRKCCRHSVQVDLKLHRWLLVFFFLYKLVGIVFVCILFDLVKESLSLMGRNVLEVKILVKLLGKNDVAVYISHNLRRIWSLMKITRSNEQKRIVKNI